MFKKLCLVLTLLSLTAVCVATVKIGPFINTGYITGYLFPSHNEYDPNQGIFPLADRAVARYGLDTYTSFALADYPRLFVYGDLLSLFGDTRPQTDYNYHATPIVGISTVGMGFKITQHFTAGLATSKHWKYSNNYKGESLMWSAVTLSVHW